MKYVHELQKYAKFALSLEERYTEFEQWYVCTITWTTSTSGFWMILKMALTNRIWSLKQSRNILAAAMTRLLRSPEGFSSLYGNVPRRNWSARQRSCLEDWKKPMEFSKRCCLERGPEALFTHIEDGTSLRAHIDRVDRRGDLATAETLQRALAAYLLRKQKHLAETEIERLEWLHKMYTERLAVLLEGWRSNFDPEIAHHAFCPQGKSVKESTLCP